MTRGSFAARLERALAVRPVSITVFEGSTHSRVRLVELADGRMVVAKTDSVGLAAEAHQLQYLDRHTQLPVPAVVHASDDLLVLEYLDTGDAPPADASADGGTQGRANAVAPAIERRLGDSIGKLHAVTGDEFGFEFDTYLGEVPLSNGWMDDWIPFYRDQRLRPALRRARERGHLRAGLGDRVETLLGDLDVVIDEPDAPSLLHGDLSNGHILAEGGEIVGFLDPACYYGHSEMELAFLDWAGIVGTEFFSQYRTHRPVPDGYAVRRHAYVVFPQLVLIADGRTGFRDHLSTTLEVLGY